MKALVLFFALCLTAAPAAAQGTPSVADGHAILVTPDQVTYGPAAAALPPGAELAVLEGKPAEPGPFTMLSASPMATGSPPTIIRPSSTSRYSREPSRSVWGTSSTRRP